MTTLSKSAEQEQREALAKLFYASDWPPREKQTTEQMWAEHNKRGPDEAARRYLKLAEIAWSAQSSRIAALEAEIEQARKLMGEAASNLEWGVKNAKPSALAWGVETMRDIAARLRTASTPATTKGREGEKQ